MNDINVNKDCGKRIRAAISLCGMKLPAFGKKYKISFSHLYAIEKGLRPLNKKTAERVAIGVHQEGYSCTAQWLLTGESSSPLKDAIQPNEMGENDVLLSSLSPELKVMQEASLFRKLYDNSIVSCILDDSMEPIYAKGDYVGGCFAKNIKDAVGKDCIVVTQEGEELIRKLIKGSKSGLFTLICLNPHTRVSPPILFDHPIEAVAPIVWLRRRHY